MSHNILKAAVPNVHTPNSPTKLKPSSGVNQHESHWWDNVFEAADLVKFMKHASSSQAYASDKNCCNVVDGLEDNNSASGVCAVPCHSSTSTASSDQRDFSKKQSAFEEGISPIVYPSRLKILAAKISLNSGKEHLSISGQVRRARQLKNPCHSNCKRCQVPRLTPAERLIIFDHFWSLNSHEKQWTFISNAVTVSTPKRKFAVQGSKGSKSCSREYYVCITGKKRKVCKTMFKNTLCICDLWIDSALSHVPKGLPDLRGRCKKKSSMIEGV